MTRADCGHEEEMIRVQKVSMGTKDLITGALNSRKFSTTTVKKTTGTTRPSARAASAVHRLGIHGAWRGLRPQTRLHGRVGCRVPAARTASGWGQGASHC